MKYKIDNEEYDVIVTKKANKNLYIRVKNDLKIYVTCSYFCTKKQIIDVLDKNIDGLVKMIDAQKAKQEKENMFFYLGKKYDIISVPVIDKIDIDDIHHIIYIKDNKQLDNWYKKEIIRIFTERFHKCFDMFEEAKKIPSLKIRNMKTRWGVYNRVQHSVTLNTHLIEYDIEKIDYVIFHELSHIIHFDHSNAFWMLVSKYCPNCKVIRKELKD